MSKINNNLNNNANNINNNYDNSQKINEYIMSVCKIQNCAICRFDPLSLKYSYNTFDATIKYVQFPKEHQKIIKLSESIIFNHGNYKFMFERYECDNYSNVIVMRIFSGKKEVDIDIVLQSYLNTLGDYKSDMVYSAELHDKKKSSNKWWVNSIIFNTIDTQIFQNFVDNVCKNVSETSIICEEFREHENYNSLSIVGSKLTNVGHDDLKINKPVIINDYKTFSKLQKRLNIGYRNYYNNSTILRTTETWQAIVLAVEDFTITIVLTHHRASIIISKIGAIVSNDDMKFVLMKILNLHDKTSTDSKPMIHKLTDVSKSTWNQNILSKRSFDSIYLPSELKNNIKDSIETFIASEEAYAKLGITYKLGLLFFGPPGTGKTSLVKAIASDYNMSIYVMDLNNSGINDETISNVLNSLPYSDRYKILLFEDVDCAFVDKEKVKNEVKISVNQSEMQNNKNSGDNGDGVSSDSSEKSSDNSTKTVVEEKHLTYSGLLNAFDGVTSNQNRVIMIMTTNYKNKLGSALIRPGRIDYAYCVDYCNKTQIIEMIDRILDVLNNSNLNNIIENNLSKRIDEFASNVINMCTELNVGSDIVKGVTPAKLQAYIMKYAKKMDLLFSNYAELFADD